MYGHPDASGEDKRLTATLSAACTAACTSEGENANAGTPEAASLDSPPQAADTLEIDQGSEGEGAADKPADPLAGLAAAIAGLTPADRERLAAMLGGKTG